MNAKEMRECTVKELKSICKEEGLTGYSKLTKDEVVAKLIANNRKKTRQSKASIAPASGSGTTPASKGPLKDMSCEMESHKTGSKVETMITVSCGANSGDFPVCGRSVAEVSDFLKDVLNVSSLANGVVNGVKAAGSYILSEGDTLEFVKPAGSKG